MFKHSYVYHYTIICMYMQSPSGIKIKPRKILALYNICLSMTLAPKWAYKKQR